MGIMTALVMNNIVSPLSNFWSGMFRTFEIMGYARAASELARLGYYEESKNCMMQIKNIKDGVTS
jgi:hypothetical protein